MIKVLHFELAGAIGGIESFLLSFLKLVNKEEFSFEFITSSENFPLKDDFLSNGGKINLIPSIKKYGEWRKTLIELLKKENYDIVHFHKNSAANIFAIKLVRKYSPSSKIIIHSHNSLPARNKLYLKLLHYCNRKYIKKVADLKYACSNKARVWMYGKNRTDVGIIDNGVDVVKFKFNLSERERIRHQYNISDEQCVIGHIGRFNKQKNHVFFINKIKYAKEKNLNYKFMFIGNGPLFADFKHQIEINNLQEYVILCGERKDVNSYVNAFDLFVLPSLYEGLPIVGVECQANGLNCFLSDKITTEVKILSNVEFFPLNITEKDFFKMFETEPQCSYNDRIKRNALIFGTKYDFQYSVSKIESDYKNLLGKK